MLVLVMNQNQPCVTNTDTTDTNFHQEASCSTFRVASKVATRGINFGILIKIPQNVETRLTIDITTSIETNFGVHLPLPLFTF